MKLYAPSYYGAFRCLAGACRHSCCIGWEIDVDEDTLAYYQTLPGDIGRELKKNITLSEDAASFRLTPEKRCPFLNEQGLCRLILTLGEDSLCQICADHPRFRGFFANRTEIGLGLCCEGAARLALTWPHKVHWQLVEDDGVCETIPAEEQALLDRREKWIQIVQNRSLPIRQRVDQLMPMKMNWPLWRDRLLQLERMDDAWADALRTLTLPAQTEKLSAPEWETAFEQLMVYLLSRHLPAALEDGEADGHLRYCVFIWQLIYRLCAVQPSPSIEGLCELARLYSSEIEYSDENVGAIISDIDKNGFCL